MAVIENPTGRPLHKDNPITLDSVLLPSFRILLARQNKVDDSLLIRMRGGIGDNVCTEPAVRWALRNFKNVKISVSYEYPELFQHLPLHELIDSNKKEIDLDKYLVFDSFQPDGHLANEFVAPPFTHCVDYATINMFRCQIPHAERCVQLSPTESQKTMADTLIDKRYDVVVHPGLTWPSRTLPKWWWDEVIDYLIVGDARPVIVGGDVIHATQSRGTLDVITEGCLDLRNKLNVMESVAVMQRAQVVLTNDSAPLHMAASGDAWIGFLSTVRHPEIITHYRNGGLFGYRMKNFARGGLWQDWDMCPTSPGQINFSLVRESQMKSWLPDPKEFAQWALDKLGLSGSKGTPKL